MLAEMKSRWFDYSNDAFQRMKAILCNQEINYRLGFTWKAISDILLETLLLEIELLNFNVIQVLNWVEKATLF